MTKLRPIFRHPRVGSAMMIMLALFGAFLATLLVSEETLAQIPPNFRTPPTIFPDVESSEAEAGTLPQSASQLRRIIVDTDPGVDDAAALIWLLSQNRYQVQVEGIVTVTGNVTATQGVSNTQMILGWLGLDIPVIHGASAPLVQPHSLVPWLIHGSDGLWFTAPTPGLPGPDGASAFYCSELEPGMLVLALGPLTNIANAMASCPTAWSGVEIISVGGTKSTPSQTPVTEFNYWQDPEAAQQVLTFIYDEDNAGIEVTIQMVLADAFDQFKITDSTMRQLSRRGNEAIQNLLPALARYSFSLSQGGEVPALPDAAAAIYALENGLGTSRTALVEVLAGPGIPEVARGQTILGLSFNDHIVMIAGDAVLSDIAVQATFDEDFDITTKLLDIFFSKPDNAIIVEDIDARRMQNIFMQGLRARNTTTTSGTSTSLEQSDFENQLFVPLIVD